MAESRTPYIKHPLEAVEETQEVSAESLGISGLAMDFWSGIDSQGFDTSIKYRDLMWTMCISAQCFFLELTVLYYMYGMLEARDEPITMADVKEHLWEGNDDLKIPPMIMVFISVYIHVITQMNDWCSNAKIVRMAVLTHTREHRRHGLIRLVMILDSLVIPFLTLSIGSLYLCTSDGVADLILNSCAVAFVCQIDDWIVDGAYNWLGKADTQMINLSPLPAKFASAGSMLIYMFPIGTISMVMGYCYLAFFVLQV